ncbi:MAG TPA: hypothetical protein VGR14_03775 [Verrucomicrobiae bacterium]|jgi:hypothetical protein|nr:hypothetical protein [Verrucomicrobiae bacterium]
MNKNAMSDQDIPDLPEYAIDLEADLMGAALGGPPAKCTPEEGIRRMEARVKGLQGEMKDVLNGADQTPETLTAARRRLVPQLQDAQRRLAEYQVQRDGKN